MQYVVVVVERGSISKPCIMLQNGVNTAWILQVMHTCLIGSEEAPHDDKNSLLYILEYESPMVRSIGQRGKVYHALTKGSHYESRTHSPLLPDATAMLYSRKTP